MVNDPSTKDMFAGPNGVHSRQYSITIHCTTVHNLASSLLWKPLAHKLSDPSMHAAITSYC